MIIVAAHSCGMKFNPSHANNMSSELNVKQIEEFIISYISNIAKRQAQKKANAEPEVFQIEINFS